jgi:hypothetical protein
MGLGLEPKRVVFVIVHGISAEFEVEMRYIHPYM